jgi:hypothetical protein
MDGNPIGGLASKPLWTVHLTFSNTTTWLNKCSVKEVQGGPQAESYPGFYCLVADGRVSGGVEPAGKPAGESASLEWAVPTACGIALYRKAVTKPRKEAEVRAQIVVPVAFAWPKYVQSAIF